ncbi:MAG: hypothetical protein FJY97_06600 [candidate division Zixibacteria bacterium]|nr:hypothetical protein [candidate division Zixibacteria bacterium]
MKITDIKLIILEDPEQPQGYFKLREVPGLRRIQYTHGSQMIPNDRYLRQSFLKVLTDDGVEGMCTTTMTPIQVEILRTQVLGENPLERERLYQMLHKGTRWVYQQAGWFGDFDNCLWDLFGKVTCLPVYDLIGRVRPRFPVYLTSGESPLEVYLDVIDKGREYGVNAYKFHTYKGGKADISIFREVRRIVGPDYLLMNDPVCSYTLEEAIEVGHVMEELGFLWLEEPLHEQKERQYRRLCKALTMPVMGNETLMHDIGLSTQRLMSGATDLLRANARFGTSQVLKMAHFAEMYDTNIELNHEGGLFGLVHAHLGCCIDNTGFFEAGSDNLTGRGQCWGLLNPPPVVDGHLTPPDGPGWGAEWDWDRFNHMTVETH